MPESSPQGEPELKKRRSTRIVQAVPLIVTGVDALGRSFQERTSTLIINCHGCRYKSKHEVTKDMWVTLEIPQPVAGEEPRIVQGQVTWARRPRSDRELFDIAVQFEAPANVWGIAFPPENWSEFPEPGEKTTGSPGGGAPAGETREQAAARDWFTAGEEPQPGNVHVMPPPGGTELSQTVARQMARLMVEARQQVQSAVREATAKAVGAEVQLQLAAMQDQLKEMAEKFLRSAAAGQPSGSGRSAAAAKLDSRAQETLSRLEELLPKAQQINAELQPRLAAAQEISQERLASQLAEAWKSWSQKLEADMEPLAQKLAADAQRHALASVKNLEQELARRAETLAQSFDQTNSEAENRLGTLCTALEAETARSKASLEEIREGANQLEDTASRLEAMSRAANDELKWYEKKVQAQLQTVFEKGLDQAVNALKEKAGEISGKFASQLDHYSRSYIEHTQAQLDENIKAVIERTRGIVSKTAETVAAATGQELFAQLQENLNQEIEKGLADLRAEREALQEQLQETVFRADDQAVENYKKRLENVSNQWLVTTVALLNKQSEETIEALSKAASERLRETCTQVFNKISEAMRQRLLDFSTMLPGDPSRPPDEK